ncbi:MAG: DUF2061 domain-containing protein [Legionellaceae bacterium]|nr:DUF2061 domain-containing protein [Legionellaceae bacterium]
MLIKTLSFAVVHFSIAFSVTFFLTGNLLLGGAIALIEPLCNTFAYHLHEKLWSLRGRSGQGNIMPS